MASTASAQRVPIEPDDGAPPSEYEPQPGGRVIAAPTVLDTLDSLDDLDATQAMVGEPAPSPPWHNALPVSGFGANACANNFGAPRGGGRTHLGVDCFAPIGTPLVAVESGTIRYATEGGPFSCPANGDGSGNRVSVRGRSGYVYYYGHLDRILVGQDQWVERGQVIGTVGRTGNAACSTPHLHLEVKCGENGAPFDPYPWVNQWGRYSPPDDYWWSTASQGVGVTYSGPDRQDLFALECQRIRQRLQTRGSGISDAWYGLDNLHVTADPDAASQGPGYDPQIFVRATDLSIYQLYWTGSYWDVVHLGGVCTSGPTAVYTDARRLDVFCRGQDGALWQRSWESWRGWTPGWYYVGGIVTSDPDAVSPSPTEPVEIAVRGYDSSAYLMYWNGAGWAWENVGGVCTSGPSAAYRGPDRLDVYCRGIDMAMWRRSWRADRGWEPWTWLGGAFISDPETTSHGPGTPTQVFGRGVDRRVYQLVREGSTDNWDRVVWGVT